MSATASQAPAAGAPPAEPTAEQAAAPLRSKRFVVLLVIVAVVGVIVSLAAWCFLEAIHQIQQELYTHLPHALGYSSGPPLWWSLPVLAVAGLLFALAIERLPGEDHDVRMTGVLTPGRGVIELAER